MGDKIRGPFTFNSSIWMFLCDWSRECTYIVFFFVDLLLPRLLYSDHTALFSIRQFIHVPSIYLDIQKIGNLSLVFCISIPLLPYRLLLFCHCHCLGFTRNFIFIIIIVSAQIQLHAVCFMTLWLEANSNISPLYISLVVAKFLVHGSPEIYFFL